LYFAPGEAADGGPDRGDPGAFAPGRDEGPGDQEGLEQGDQAMRPLEDHPAVEGRDQRAVAQGPIRAGQAGAVDSHPTSQDGEGKRRSRRQE
jgi:hypothetical protein